MEENPPTKRFDKWVEFLRNIATVVALTGTVAFFISPQLERWLAERFGIHAWYFATELKITEEGGRVVKEQGVENFYHFLWSRENDFDGGVVRDDDQALGAFLRLLQTVEGNIVFKNAGKPTPGRESERVNSRVLSLAKEDECFRVLETKFVQGREPLPHNVYLKLVRVPCL